MEDWQKEKVQNSLKTGRVLNSGQTLEVLASVAEARKSDVSAYLQSLKRKGKVTYFPRTKVWYWNDPIKSILFTS